MRVGLCVLALLAVALPAQAGRSWEEMLADAEAFRRAGDFSAAQSTLRSALDIASKENGRDLRLAVTWQLMASVSQDLGRYAEAESCYRKAIAILERDLGPDHVRVAFALRDFSTLYLDAREFSKSEKLARRALDVLTRARGPEDIEVAHVLNALGVIAYARKRPREAHGYCLRALGICEKTGAGQSEDAAHVLNNLGVIETRMGRYADALERYRRVLGIFERLFAPEHPAHISAQTNIADLYARTGHPADALVFIDRALESARRYFGDGHPRTAKVLAVRAVVLRALGEKHQARQAEKTARAILDNHAGMRAMRERVDISDLAAPARAAKGVQP